MIEFFFDTSPDSYRDNTDDRLLRRTLVLSVRYSAFAKFSFDFDVSAINAVDDKKIAIAV